jgi:hypothetical protein
MEELRYGSTYSETLQWTGVSDKATRTRRLVTVKVPPVSAERLTECTQMRCGQFGEN